MQTACQCKPQSVSAIAADAASGVAHSFPRFLAGRATRHATPCRAAQPSRSTRYRPSAKITLLAASRLLDRLGLAF